MLACLLSTQSLNFINNGINNKLTITPLMKLKEITPATTEESFIVSFISIPKSNEYAGSTIKYFKPLIIIAIPNVPITNPATILFTPLYLLYKYATGKTYNVPVFKFVDLPIGTLALYVTMYNLFF